MANITKPRQILLYAGPSLALASASFLGRISRIYRYNASGTVLIGYDPTKTVNGFNTLEDGVGYVVYSSSVPYEIPTTASVRPQALPFVNLADAFVKTT